MAGWIGGQMVLVGLLPLLRTLGPDVPRLAAARFARVAWPCFGLAIATGIWSLFAIDLGDRDTGYLTALLVKLLLVGFSGAAAAIHSTTRFGVDPGQALERIRAVRRKKDALLQQCDGGLVIAFL